MVVVVVVVVVVVEVGDSRLRTSVSGSVVVSG